MKEITKALNSCKNLYPAYKEFESWMKSKNDCVYLEFVLDLENNEMLSFWIDSGNWKVYHFPHATFAPRDLLSYMTYNNLYRDFAGFVAALKIAAEKMEEYETN